MRSLIDDVGEDDCFWEPTTPCWSVRRRETASDGWGRGDWVCEDIWPPPDPVPTTTIAWRMAHLAGWTEVYRSWTFEDQSVGLPQLEVPGSCEGLVEWLLAAQDRFLNAVDSLDDAGIEALRPAHFGPHLPVHRLVSGMAFEHVHHGAEIGVLRDLRRGHARVPPPSNSEAPT